MFVSVWCWCFYEAVFEQWQPVEHHRLWKLLWERDKGCEERPEKCGEGNKPQNRRSLREKEKESFISTSFSSALQLQLIFRDVLWLWDGLIGDLPPRISRIDILWNYGWKELTFMLLANPFVQSNLLKAYILLVHVCVSDNKKKIYKKWNCNIMMI